MTTMDSKSRFQSFSMASGQPSKAPSRTSAKPMGSVWNNPVWGTKGTIGNGRRHGLQDANRTPNELADSSPLPDTVTGSGSLLPSSESDNHIVRQTPWKKSSDDMSPGLSVENTSPLMRQKSSHSVANTFEDTVNGDTPYLSLTTASGNISSRSSQKNFLDPTAGNFATGMNGGISGQSRSSRHNSDESDSYAARQTVFGAKDNGLMMHSGRPSLNNNMSGYNSSAASRSGSQPPSRGDVDYSSRHRGDARNIQYPRPGPTNPTSSSYRSSASAVSANAPPFVMQAASSAPGYGETLSPAQLDNIAHYFDQLNTGREDPQASYNLPRMPFENQGVPTNGTFGLDGQSESWRMEENGYQARPDHFSPTGSGTGSLGSMSNQFRPPTLPQQYSHSPNSSDTRISHPSPFYSASGTPPSYQQRAQPRGYYTGSQAGQAATLERKLRGLQQQQQQHAFAMPQANALQFRAQLSHPYDMHTPNGVRMNPLQPYYPMAPAPHMLGGVQIPRGPARDQDVGQQVRSPLLEDFRNNSKTNKRYELKDIYNHIVEFSGDQHGSRFIQQKLETANSDEKDQVFRELHPNSLQLMTDVFGNYVIQKFFEHGNQAQKKMLANQMRNHVVALSMQIYGCRVVQKALEHILTDQQAQLVLELKEKVMQCVKDQNGNHVVQKAIERVPAEHIQFIINAFSGRVQDSATHPYGCRVIQRMLEYCEEPTRTAVLYELHACASTLIVDQYGNYVTQHVIEHGKPEDRGRIINLVTANMVNYSKHKFASNVVEKSIQFGSLEERNAMVATLSVTNEKGESPIQTLIRDQYGNYVMQKLISQLRGPEWSDFIKSIKVQISLLKQFSFGNGKQIAAVEKVLQLDPFPPPPRLQTNGAFPALDTSVAVTPALTTGDAQSPQSSGAPSTHAGSIDVAATATSRKSSGSNNNIGILTPASTQSREPL